MQGRGKWEGGRRELVPNVWPGWSPVIWGAQRQKRSLSISIQSFSFIYACVNGQLLYSTVLVSAESESDIYMYILPLGPLSPTTTPHSHPILPGPKSTV